MGFFECLCAAADAQGIRSSCAARSPAGAAAYVFCVCVCELCIVKGEKWRGTYIYDCCDMFFMREYSSRASVLGGRLEDLWTVGWGIIRMIRGQTLPNERCRCVGFLSCEMHGFRCYNNISPRV